MRITINGNPLMPSDFGKDLGQTVKDFDAVLSDPKFIDHVQQFYGVASPEKQQLYDQAVQEEINRHAIIAAAKVKAYLAVHVFDLHNLGQHLYDLMGMTS